MKLSDLNQIKGGLADNKSLSDIAKHHEYDLNKLKQQLEKGIEAELEHTSEKDVAIEIAMDHLWEDPEYYEKLATIENFNHKDRYKYNSPIMTRKIATLDNNNKPNPSGFPGSDTGGMRTSPKKSWPDKEDVDAGQLDTNIPDDTPKQLKKSNNTQPIMKEPDDWLNPKVSKHRGPGA